MEGGVEAGHSRYTGKRPADGRDAGQCGWEVQRRQIGDGREVGDYVGVDPNRFGVARPAVNDAMTHRLDAFHRTRGLFQLRVLEAPTRHLEFAVREDRIIRGDQAHLERTGAGVDDEYAHD